jgi:hypothetical protein
MPLPPETIPHPRLPRIYLVGDSISIDYHPALATLCEGTCYYRRKGGLEEALLNLDAATGANGGDSARVLAHMRELLANHPDVADTFLINCGLHDIKVDPQTGAHQVPLPLYRRNLETLLSLIAAAGKRLIWITTTPVDEVQHQSFPVSFHRYEKDLAAYNAAAREIMRGRGIPIIDLHGFTATLEVDLFRDHVHFHPEVSARQAAFIHARLKELC